MKEYFFHDKALWESGKIPMGGEDIIIRNNVRVYINKLSIKSYRYGKLILPADSELIFNDTDIVLHVTDMEILGKVKTNERCVITVDKIRCSHVKFWHEDKSWFGCHNPNHSNRMLSAGIDKEYFIRQEIDDEFNGVPNPGNPIWVPPSTTIIISDETDLSGSLYKPYKMLYIPEGSELIFDCDNKILFVERVIIRGTWRTIGKENLIWIVPGRMNMEVPIYLDSEKKLIGDNYIDAVEILDSSYNFSMQAVATTAKDLRRMLRFQRDGDKVKFVYSNLYKRLVEVSLLNDIKNQVIYHNEQFFVSRNKTSPATLGEKFVQYIADILFGDPMLQSVIKNDSDIVKDVINSNLHLQITSALTSGLKEKYLGENEIAESILEQIKKDKPDRFVGEKDGEIYFFPTITGDDVSIFVRMACLLELEDDIHLHNDTPKLTMYDLLKTTYKRAAETSKLIIFDDEKKTVRITPTIWRIVINLA